MKTVFSGSSHRWLPPLLIAVTIITGATVIAISTHRAPKPPNQQATAALPLSRWSDPATWGGTLPSADSSVTIPADKRVLLDQNVSIKNLTVLGSLEFAARDLELRSDYLMLHGTLQIGSTQQPFTHKATLTLGGQPPENIMDMGTRGILVMGGRLELHGATPKKVWSKLSDHARAGSKTLKLLDQVDWKTGDQLVIAPTDFYNDGQFQKSPETERLEVSGVNGHQVNLKTVLGAARWGKLQYATENGMSLTAGAIALPSTAARDTGGKVIPTVLDERAEVGNLTRNIVIQSVDDSAWQQDGFGAQVMVMDKASKVQISGVELRRMGQAGKLGRYPIHFHNLSYDSSGKELGDVNYAVKDSVIWNSSQRCMVIHGSSGITLKDNICYDIKGHAVFLEDAVERRNVIQGNLILKVRRPEKTRLLLKHEGEEGFGGTSSAFWITNPDNTLRGNVAADIVGHGYWLAFPTQAIGRNNAVKMNPYKDGKGVIIAARPERIPFGTFEYNTAHSVQDNGVFIDAAPTDQRDASGNVIGETAGGMYAPMQGGKDWGYDFDKWERFTLNNITVYKTGNHYGGGGGIWNRNSYPNFTEWVSADHQGDWFAGAGVDGLIARSLMIGTSLNRAVARASKEPLAALASYHSTFDMTQNLILEFPFAEGKDNQSAGVFKTGDYYIAPVDKGLKRNPDNKLINSHPGRRVQPFIKEHWTLAGALWDYNGYWGPKQNYWVYDQPFFTTGTTCQAVAPAGKNGSSCKGPYYGVGNLVYDSDTERNGFNAPIEVTRVTANGAVIGVWSVGDGNKDCPKLCNMRHFAGVKGGRYILRFPKPDGNGYNVPSRFDSEVTNLFSNSDSMLFGVSFTGAKNLQLAVLKNHAQTRILQAGSSLSAVEKDATGRTYYQDKTTQLVWVKLQGGLKPSEGMNANQQLYRAMSLELK